MATGCLPLLWLAPLAQAGSIATTISLASSPTTTAIFGQQVALTAMVSPPSTTGKVTFYDGVTIVATGTVLSGQTVVNTTLLAAGKRSLKAFYSGDTTYASSVSNAVALTINSIPGGTFLPGNGSPFAAGNRPQSIAVGDFNGDGKADFAIANSTDDGTTITVLLGTGNGGFTPGPGSPFSARYGGGASSVVVADFNGDGKADLAVAGSIIPGEITIFLGTGNGGFTQAQEIRSSREAGQDFGWWRISMKMERRTWHLRMPV